VIVIVIVVAVIALAGWLISANVIGGSESGSTPTPVATNQG
jgi:hypothetical protein